MPQKEDEKFIIHEVLISCELWQHFVYLCEMHLLLMHLNTSCLLTIHRLALTNLPADPISLNFENLEWTDEGGGRNAVDFEVITFQVC